MQINVIAWNHGQQSGCGVGRGGDCSSSSSTYQVGAGADLSLPSLGFLPRITNRALNGGTVPVRSNEMTQVKLPARSPPQCHHYCYYCCCCCCCCLRISQKRYGKNQVLKEVEWVWRERALEMVNGKGRVYRNLLWRSPAFAGFRR